MRQKHARNSRLRNHEKPAVIVLTGRQLGNRVEIIINGTTIPLSCCLFQLPVDFVVALVNNETGSLEAEAVTVYRLRAAIYDALGAGAGKRLIASGMKHRYRLAIPRKNIKFTQCFFELVSLQIISQEQADVIRACFRVVRSPKKRLS
jgi:hypothetical protein